MADLNLFLYKAVVVNRETINYKICDSDNIPQQSEAEWQVKLITSTDQLNKEIEGITVENTLELCT